MTDPDATHPLTVTLVPPGPSWRRHVDEGVRLVLLALVVLLAFGAGLAAGDRIGEERAWATVCGSCPAEDCETRTRWRLVCTDGAWRVSDG